MIVREIKKIFSVRIVFILLILLCVINVLLDTGSKAEKTEYQKERIEGYSAFLEKIETEGTAMQKFSLFSKNNQFQIENAKRTVQAYEKMKGVQPVYGNYDAIGKLLQFGFSDIILFIMMVQMALILINHEVAKGMFELLKSCRNGRTRLLFSKIAAMGFGLIVVIAGVYGSKFVELYLKYGVDNLNVPIQSVPGFYELNMPISIWQYLIIFFLLKWLALWIMGIFAVAICSFTKNDVVTYGIVLTVTGISIIIYLGINWDMSLAIVKLFSPVTLLDTKIYTGTYLNINFLQHPFQITKTALVVMGIYFIAAVVVSVVSFNRKNGGINLEKINKFTTRNKETTIKVSGIFRYEQKKVLWINKVLICIIIFAGIQAYIINGYESYVGFYDKCYKNYISKVYGVPDAESDKYIKEEHDRYEKLNKDYQQALMDMAEGKIDESEFSIVQTTYNSQMMSYDAFQAVEEKNEYLKELKNTRGINGWFTYDTGIEYIFDVQDFYDKNVSFLILFLAIILGVVPVFAYDNQVEMTRLLNTTLYGKTKLRRRKYFMAILVSLVCWLIETMPWLAIIWMEYTPTGLMAPIQSISAFDKFPIVIPIIAIVVILYLLRAMGVIILALFIVGISEIFKDYVKIFFVTMAVVAVPVILSIFGVPLVEDIMFVPLINISEYMTGTTVVQWINLLVVVSVTVIVNIRLIKHK